MNILFLTDSLGYPRVEPSNSSAADVWTYRVRDQIANTNGREHVRFYFDMKTGRDTRSLLFDVKHHVKSYQPDVIVLQVGVVDCYARALTKLEHQILPRIPLLNKLTKYLVKKHYSFIVKTRNIAYVEQSEFLANLNQLYADFPAVKWLVIPIAPANDAYAQKNPLICQRIETYNTILAKVFGNAVATAMYAEANTDKLFLPDNHHLSGYGHELVSRHIEPALSALLDH